MPVQKEHNQILTTIVTGYTTMLLGKTVLELTTQGAVHSLDLMADSYLAVMAVYAGAGEWEKWKRAGAWNPANDPWLERAQRGGVFLTLWSIPFFAAYLWRLYDPTVPYPAELKRIWTGLFTIFMAKNTSRSIRHTRKGLYPGEPGSDEAPDLSQDIFSFIKSQPDQESTTTEVCAQFPAVTRRHITRLLEQLTRQRQLERTLNPETREASYRVK